MPAITWHCHVFSCKDSFVLEVGSTEAEVQKLTYFVWVQVGSIAEGVVL